MLLRDNFIRYNDSVQHLLFVHQLHNMFSLIKHTGIYEINLHVYRNHIMFNWYKTIKLPPITEIFFATSKYTPYCPNCCNQFLVRRCTALPIDCKTCFWYLVASWWHLLDMLQERIANTVHPALRSGSIYMHPSFPGEPLAKYKQLVNHMPNNNTTYLQWCKEEKIWSFPSTKLDSTATFEATF